MPVAIVLISVALVLYTTAIWSEKIKKRLLPWMLLIFVIALVCDIIGTTMMGYQNGGFALHLHSFCGLLALIIMLIHLLWAVDALARGGRCQELFTKYSVWAWCLWLIAFLTGIPK
jgi:uncharacterized repeat protein (TIGR03987 family)